MTMINVSIRGKKLFDWTGDAAAIQMIDDRVVNMAAEAKVTPDAFAQSVAVHLADKGHFFTDECNEMLPMMWWLLSMPTNNPNHPGICRDYVEVWNFDFDVTGDSAKRLNVGIHAHFVGGGTA